MLFATTASAYIDPASSTYILQIIAGVFIAGGITMGIYWHKIKRFFRKTFKKNSQK
jgi:high-affinity Fe2+/Pb2+ permease